MSASAPALALSVHVKHYVSPTVVMLAMDWPAGANHKDFLGFAILRSPGFAKGEKDGYLLNKIGFTPISQQSHPLPSNLAPIQKFVWWDSAIAPGQNVTYTVTPVLGSGPGDLKLLEKSAATVAVAVPQFTEHGISTYFNRAVVSSQAFSRKFPDPAKDLDAVMAWLANGLESAFPNLLDKAADVVGAIYHLTDNEWVIPALKGHHGKIDLAYNSTGKDHPSEATLQIFENDKLTMHPRTHASIMHDKFLVDVANGRVLTGSANFTPEGLTSQANLLHVFDSPQLAGLYSQRQKLLADNSPMAEIAKGSNWSNPITVGDAKIRIFFSPEPGGRKSETATRKSLDAVVNAVKKAKESVIFCMYSPTDSELLNAMLAAGDKGKILLGLLNSISDPTKKKKTDSNNQSDSGEPPAKPSAATQVQITLYKRSRKDKKVLSYDYFRPGAAPAGFLPEFNSVDLTSKSIVPPAPSAKKSAPPAVHIHHKFVLVDAETSHPVIYTGSNNMSHNSTYNNDENLLEITECPRLAQIYLSEFIRLYEHYRARAVWDMNHPKGKTKKTAGSNADLIKNRKLQDAFTLKTTRDEWVKAAYKKGTQDYLMRTRLANPS